MEGRDSVPNLHATPLRRLGIDRASLTYSDHGRAESLNPELIGTKAVEELRRRLRSIRPLDRGRPLPRSIASLQVR